MFFRSAAAAVMTWDPARVLPVIATMSTSGWETRARPVSRSPQTMLTTPGGNASAASSPSSTVDHGVVSDGFSTTVFPAARAGPSFHTAIING